MLVFSRGVDVSLVGGEHINRLVPPSSLVSSLSPPGQLEPAWRMPDFSEYLLHLVARLLLTFSTFFPSPPSPATTSSARPCVRRPRSQKPAALFLHDAPASTTSPSPLLLHPLFVDLLLQQRPFHRRIPPRSLCQYPYLQILRPLPTGWLSVFRVWFLWFLILGSGSLCSVLCSGSVLWFWVLWLWVLALCSAISGALWSGSCL